MKTFCLALLGISLMIQGGYTQTATSVAGQSVWRHDSGTSGTGQSIWRHNTTRARQMPAVVRQDVVRGGIRRNSPILLLGIGSTCDFGYNGCESIDPSLAYQETQGFYQPGYQWGAGLKQNQLAWADFMPYLEQFLLNAPPVLQDAFRQGFIEGFGGNAEATYDYAFRQAARPG